MWLNVLLNHDDFVYVNYIVSQNGPPPIVNEPGKVILLPGTDLQDDPAGIVSGPQ